MLNCQPAHLLLSTILIASLNGCKVRPTDASLSESLLLKNTNEVKKSVVYITASSGQSQLNLPDISVGSGAFVSDDGYIITNYHVIAPAIQSNDPGRYISCLTSEYEAAIRNKDPLPIITAEYIVGDEGNDVALLKLSNPNKRRFLVLGSISKDDFGVGKDVFSMGHPGRDPYVFSQGRTLDLKPQPGWREGDPQLREEIIQTSSFVIPGYSGGILVGARDKMIFGVPYAYYGENLIGEYYALPIWSVRYRIYELLREAKKNIPIGLKFADKTDGSNFVLEVEPGSMAERVGFEVGDQVTALGDALAPDALEVELQLFKYAGSTIKINRAYGKKDILLNTPAGVNR